MTLGVRAGGAVLQVLPECHRVCVSDCPWLRGRGSDVSLLGPPLPGLTKLGTLASCCHFLTGCVWSLILPASSVGLEAFGPSSAFLARALHLGSRGGARAAEGRPAPAAWWAWPAAYIE